MLSTLLRKSKVRIPRNGSNYIGDLLTDHNLISIADLRNAESVASRRGITLVDALLEGGFLSASELSVFLTLQIHLPVMDITHAVSQQAALDALPMGAALAYKALPLSIEGNVLTVATERPLYKSVSGLELLTGLEVREIVSLRGSVHGQILSRYRPNRNIEANGNAEEGVKRVSSRLTKKKRSTTKRRNKRKSKATSAHGKVNTTDKLSGLTSSPEIERSESSYTSEMHELIGELTMARDYRFDYRATNGSSPPKLDEQEATPTTSGQSVPNGEYAVYEASENTLEPENAGPVGQQESSQAFQGAFLVENCDSEPFDDGPKEDAPAIQDRSDRENRNAPPEYLESVLQESPGELTRPSSEPLDKDGRPAPNSLNPVLHIDRLVIQAGNLEQNLSAQTVQQHVTAQTVQQNINAYNVEQRLEAYQVHQQIHVTSGIATERPDNESQEFQALERPRSAPLLAEFPALAAVADEIRDNEKRAKTDDSSLRARSNWTPEIGDSSPAVKVVDLIIAGAIRERASDIHIEPQEEELEIRYRIDGTLRTVHNFPLSVHRAIISRIKVMANMDISEHRIPQDGQFSYYSNGRTVDFRVATIDTHYGEMAVLRLLDKSASYLSLKDIGMRQDMLLLYRSVLDSPYGMVLVSGPTGSGKTTSLYASLGEFDPKERKIVTVEDPVEYKISGINQVQVNRQAGLSFSTGLRGILRLDPDVILVGEIRDPETADTAVQAALTGHTVLSSIHANDAAGALIRLVDMGVEPFLVNSAVLCSLAQRLVRKPCEACKRPAQAPFAEAQAYAKEIGEERALFDYGVGCEACGDTGYSGRTAVFELLMVTDAVKQLLMKRATASEIRAQAITEGMTSMIREAMMKVRDNITTPSEVMRKIFTRL